MFVDRSS